MFTFRLSPNLWTGGGSQKVIMVRLEYTKELMDQKQSNNLIPLISNDIKKFLMLCLLEEEEIGEKGSNKLGKKKNEIILFPFPHFHSSLFFNGTERK